MKALRSVSLLCALGAALSAQALTTYSFAASNGIAFVLERPDFVAASSSFGRDQLAQAHPDSLSSVAFGLESSPGFPAPYLAVAAYSGTYFYYFAPGDFQTVGTHGDDYGRLVVSDQPVPEPASLLSLGVPALALTRRRKRA